MNPGFLLVWLSLLGVLLLIVLLPLLFAELMIASLPKINPSRGGRHEGAA